MSELLSDFWTRVLGKRLGLRLRVYKPDNIADDNKVIYSYIYGVDDVVEDDYGYRKDTHQTEPLNLNGYSPDL